MADRVKYERLQDLKAGVSARQGIFVYAPIAQQEKPGIAKGSESITVNADGSLDVSVDAKSKFIQVLSTIPDDLSPYEGSLFVYQDTGYTDVLYKVIDGQLIPTDLELDEVKVSKVTDAGSNVELRFTDSAISVYINGVQHVFGYTEGTTFFPFHYNKSEVDNLLNVVKADVTNLYNTKVDNVIADNDGSPFPERNAEIEVNRVGNDVKVSAKVRLSTYAPTKNMIKNAYTGDDSGIYVSEDTVNDTVKGAIVNNDRQLRDTVKNVVNEVGTTNTWQTNANVNSKISTHNDDANSHLSLRTLINNLQKEIDRLNAKGRSWGEIDKTYSELVAMGEPIASEYISDYLAVAFGHTPAEIGDLVYTKVSDTEPEYEMEFNGSLWVSNGAYLVSKASNTQMGLVQGDLTYVSILNGLIQVLKSDYATNVGSSGASYDYDDLLALFTEVANDIYKKSETYSNAQIEQRITDLLGLANLQDTAIEKSAGVFVFNNGDTFPITNISQYNWIIARFYVSEGGKQDAYYTLLKPSEVSTGNRTLVYIQRSPSRYAEIKRTNGNAVFNVVDIDDITYPAFGCTMKAWGIKLDGITASEISYDGTISGLSSTNVKTAIDELSSEKADKTYVDSQDLTKADKVVLTNLVLNGDLLIAKPSPNENQALGFTYSDLTNISLSGGIATFTPTAQFALFFYTNVATTFNTNDVYYLFANVKSSSNKTYLSGSAYNVFHSGNGQYQFLSLARKITNTLHGAMISTSEVSPNFTPIEVDYIGAINLTATFGAGNEPTKEQMDAIIKLKGFFQTTTIDLKDVFLIDKYQEARMTPTLTNATTTYLTYRKDDLGYVDIVGNLTITTFGTNFTFPSGYRPLTQLRLPILTSTNTLGYIIINTDGTVVSNANATIYINSRFATI